MSRLRTVIALTALGLASAAQAQTGGPRTGNGSDPATSGGNGTLYIGTYAKNILIVDEATMKIKDSIRTSIGIPGLSLSFDRKHLYLSDPASEKFEIVDIATKRSLGVHTLTDGDKRVRMWGFSLDPKERFAVL